MAAAGRDVINMAVGVPDFDAPRLAREAAIAAVESGAVKYTPAAGLKSLRRPWPGTCRRPGVSPMWSRTSSSATAQNMR